jgi:hypothetical protein
LDLSLKIEARKKTREGWMNSIGKRKGIKGQGRKKPGP